MNESRGNMNAGQAHMNREHEWGPGINEGQDSTNKGQSNVNIQIRARAA